MTDIFYILSKTLYILAMPLTWVFLLLMYIWFAKRSLKKNIAVFITLLFLYLSSTPFLVNHLMLWWEIPPTAFSEMEKYDVGIVLSGPVNNFKSPKDRVYIGRGSDRFLHTADLYRKGLIKNVVVTGGHKPLSGKIESEAEKIKEVLMKCGVPDSVIFWEADAKNTRENAINSAKILFEKFPDQKYLVITSGFHMRRSLACFDQAGVEADGFSTDFYTVDAMSGLDPMTFVPNSNSFNTFSILVHEIVGLLTYKLVGYA